MSDPDLCGNEITGMSYLTQIFDDVDPKSTHQFSHLWKSKHDSPVAVHLAGLYSCTLGN